MAKNLAKVDRHNIEWFGTRDDCASLMSIQLTTGTVRGLRALYIEFGYPITAIAGRNGSGKTTVLALAACAFHNTPDGYHLPTRKTTYYTFGDFFVQSHDEPTLDGVEIEYGILCNQWKIDAFPDGKGFGIQTRKKKPFGRWNDYDLRVNRNVVFFGLGRVVPHAEKSVSKSYRGSFRAGERKIWSEKVLAIVGRILGRGYSHFRLDEYGKHRLAVVSIESTTYSGFNMGAGEDALFELIYTLHDCPRATLFIIDEIELGLHEDAQARLIQELKKICLDRHIQVICTTHSGRILEELPPIARIYLQRSGKKIDVIPEISAAFATGKLSGKDIAEIDILVEDSTAERLVHSAMPLDMRRRVNIIAIGSAAAVMRSLAARYIESGKSRDATAFLDADQRNKESKNISVCTSAMERQRNGIDQSGWVRDRLHYLPGETPPEQWIVAQRDPDQLAITAQQLGCSVDELAHILDESALADAHSIFYEASQRLSLPVENVAAELTKLAVASAKDEMAKLCEVITQRLAAVAK
ncbi:MAG TPA: AAA family ATPase [Candidatus Kapabacteria bacterium]|nr:AAA family ATPase [Candidatus Kapabacteria bacterium]